MYHFAICLASPLVKDSCERELYFCFTCKHIDLLLRVDPNFSDLSKEFSENKNPFFLSVSS